MNAEEMFNSVQRANIAVYCREAYFVIPGKMSNNSNPEIIAQIVEGLTESQLQHGGVIEVTQHKKFVKPETRVHFGLAYDEGDEYETHIRYNCRES